MEEIIYDPTTSNSPEAFIANKVTELWKEVGAANKYAKLYAQREFGADKNSSKSFKAAMKMAKKVVGDTMTFRDIRDEFAQSEIIHQAILAMVNKIRTEVNVTKSLALHAPNIADAIKKVNELAWRREGYVIELDIDTHNEPFGAPF